MVREEMKKRRSMAKKTKSWQENPKRKESIKELQTLCNVGPRTAERLYFAGIKTVAEMKKSNPEELYEKLKAKEGGMLDRCVLYQVRGAILDIPWWECKDR